MERLYDLVDQISASGPQLAVFAMLFAAVVLAVYALIGLFSQDAVARRMQRRQERSGGGRMVRLQEALSRYAEPLAPRDEEERSQLRLLLIQAGYRSPNASRIYLGLRVVLAVTLFAATLVILPLISGLFSMEVVFLLMALAVAVGFYAPVFWVRMRASARRQQVHESFPDALDLLLVCVEAGMGLDAAVARIAEELYRAHPVLAEHLHVASLELRAGRSREDTLRNLAARTGVNELHAFSTLLIQSQELGTSIGDTLRVYAADMRTRRMLAAEEKAQKLPVKLVAPMTCLLLPALMVVVLFPAIIRIVDMFVMLGGRIS